jgi:predicted nucleic acid-binding protein
MKVFLDTNIFLEYFERRRQYEAVSQLLSAVEDGRRRAKI